MSHPPVDIRYDRQNRLYMRIYGAISDTEQAHL